MGFWDNLLARRVPAPVPGPSLPPPVRVESAPVGAQRFDSLENTLSGLGTEFDLGAAARPNARAYRLTPLDLESLYRSNGYAQRIVDFFADESTRKGWRIVDTSDEPVPLAVEEERLQVTAHVQQALTWARLYGGALIVPVLDELPSPRTDQLHPLRTPIDASRVKRVRALLVFDAWEFSALTYGTDPREPNYREPTVWSVQTEGARGSMELHHSRAFYLPGVQLSPRLRRQNGGIDDSVLQVCWDAIRNKTSIDQGGASLGQRLALNVLKVGNLKAHQTSDQEQAFNTKMKALARSMSLLNLLLLGESDDFQVRATPVSGFRDLDQSAKETLSCVSGIPLAILFGEPPGGLNTDGRSHREAVNNAVAAYQEAILREPLTRLYRLLYAQKDGPTRGKLPESWHVEFNPLDELSELQRADLELKHTQTDAIRMQWGVVTPEHVATSRHGPDGYGNELLPVEATDSVPTEVPAAIVEQVRAELAEASPATATTEGE